MTKKRVLVGYGVDSMSLFQYELRFYFVRALELGAVLIAKIQGQKGINRFSGQLLRQFLAAKLSHIVFSFSRR